MPATFVQVGEAAHDRERQALRHLVDGLPDDYSVYGNPLLAEYNGPVFELDAVVAPHAIYVVEIKSYTGTIEGNDNHWNIPAPIRSPLRLIRQTAQKLASLLRSSSGYDAKRPFVEGFVFLNASASFPASSAPTPPSSTRRAWRSCSISSSPSRCSLGSRSTAESSPARRGSRRESRSGSRSPKRSARRLRCAPASSTRSARASPPRLLLPGDAWLMPPRIRPSRGRLSMARRSTSCAAQEFAPKPSWSPSAKSRCGASPAWATRSAPPSSRSGDGKIEQLIGELQAFADRIAPAQEPEPATLSAIWMRAFERLDPHSSTVIEGIFGLRGMPKTQQELAKELGILPSAVGQALNKGLDTIDTRFLHNPIDHIEGIVIATGGIVHMKHAAERLEERWPAGEGLFATGFLRLAAQRSGARISRLDIVEQECDELLARPLVDPKAVRAFVKEARTFASQWPPGDPEAGRRSLRARFPLSLEGAVIPLTNEIPVEMHSLRRD